MYIVSFVNSELGEGVSLVPVVLVLFSLTVVVYCSILLSTVAGAAWVLACFMYIKANGVVASCT